MRRRRRCMMITSSNRDLRCVPDKLRKAQLGTQTRGRNGYLHDGTWLEQQVFLKNPIKLIDWSIKMQEAGKGTNEGLRKLTRSLPMWQPNHTKVPHATFHYFHLDPTTREQMSEVLGIRTDTLLHDSSDHSCWSVTGAAAWTRSLKQNSKNIESSAKITRVISLILFKSELRVCTESRLC